MFIPPLCAPRYGSRKARDKLRAKENPDRLKEGFYEFRAVEDNRWPVRLSVAGPTSARRHRVMSIRNAKPLARSPSHNHSDPAPPSFVISDWQMGDILIGSL